MKKITKEILLECAHNLMFDLTDEELDKLLIEFDIIEKQMELIGDINGVDNVEPMSFPYDVFLDSLREDIPTPPVDRKKLLKNTNDVQDGQIKLPKVVKR